MVFTDHLETLIKQALGLIVISNLFLISRFKGNKAIEKQLILVF